MIFFLLKLKFLPLFFFTNSLCLNFKLSLSESLLFDSKSSSEFSEDEIDSHSWLVLLMKLTFKLCLNFLADFVFCGLISSLFSL